MLAVFITLTPGRRNEFVDCQKPKVQIANLSIVDVKTWWNSRMELLERADWLREFTCKWLKHSKFSDCRSLYTTQDAWTIVMYIMEMLMPFRYWTLWMSKRHTVALHHVTTIFNDMFDHLDGVLRAPAKKKTQRKDDLYFAVKFARQSCPNTLLKSLQRRVRFLFQHIFLILFRSCNRLGNGTREWLSILRMRLLILPNTMRHFWSMWRTNTAPNIRCLSVTTHYKLQSNDFIHSAMPSQSGQSSCDPYDMSSGDKEY